MLRPALALSLLISSVASAQYVGDLGPGTHSWAGNVTMTGDVTVPAGATLTIQPGTTVTAAATDSQGSGDISNKVELIVFGTLNISGVNNGGVTLTGTGTANNAWGGIVVRAGGTATISSASMDKMQGGLRVYVGASGVTTSLTVSNSSVSSSLLAFSSSGSGGTGTFQFTNTTLTALNGSAHAGGGLTLTDSTLSGASDDYALRMTGGTLSAVGTAIVNNNDGVSITGGTTASFDRCTISFNDGYGIFTNVGTTAHNTTLVSSIVSHNGSYGLYRNSSGTFSVTNSNLWGNSGTVVSGVPSASANSVGTNAIGFSSLSLAYGNTNNLKSENPLFVDAAARNYRLTHRSPSRKSGSSGVDQGALPYTTNQTATLQGTIWENLTLSGAQT
ncbi:MAG: right-handed parallel beta-helix repeat-containing protein, partial [Archangium sp.]